MTITDAPYRAAIESSEASDAPRVVIYIRVSTDEQGKTGFSIPEQRRDLLAAAEREGWVVMDIVVDNGHSGAVGIRPGLDKIMGMAEAGMMDLVLAKKRNRLFRSRYYRLMYEKDLRGLGVSLVALDDTGNRFADAMNDEFNDWFREEVAKNTAAGKMEKARQGKLIGTRTPMYGFAHTKDREGYVVAPHKMAVVERIIRAVASGTPLHAVKRSLEKAGIPAPGGGDVWSVRTVQQIVLQEAYRPVPYEELAPMLTAEARSRIEPGEEYGVVWYPRRKVTRGDPDPARDYKRPQKSESCPREEQVPIPVASSGIPREVVDAARRAIQDNRPVRSNGHRVYELAGIVRCAGCGNLMSANRKFWNGKPYHYYRCTRYMRDGLKGCEMNRGLRAEETEERVLHAVLDAVKDKRELIRKTNETFEQEKASILRFGEADGAEWHRRLDAVERQRARAQRAYMEEAIGLDDLRARSAELDAEKSHLENLLAEHSERAERLRALEEDRDRAVQQIRRGEWTNLGITAPEARQGRYREIGLEARAASDGTILLSWGLGEEAILRINGDIRRG